ncbi:MAG: hypothetical protein ACRES5_10520 [Pseudomonas sp.]
MSRLPDRPRLMSASPVERPLQRQDRAHITADTATPAWRQARDLYLNHIMTCRGCYAPAIRHCAAGADLRITYDATPMAVPDMTSGLDGESSSLTDTGS